MTRRSPGTGIGSPASLRKSNPMSPASATASIGSVQRRVSVVPGRRALVCPGDLEDQRLLECPSRDLEPDRQALAGEAAGQGNRRQAKEVVGVHEARLVESGIEVDDVEPS